MNTSFNFNFVFSFLDFKKDILDGIYYIYNIQFNYFLNYDFSNFGNMKFERVMMIKNTNLYEFIFFNKNLNLKKIIWPFLVL
jgi:hypothetical protein